MILAWFTAVWRLLPAQSGHSRLETIAWQLLLAGFGLEVVFKGDPLRHGMIAANHTSWVDIAALAATSQSAFVAKREVRAWPVIGKLAERIGCVFVDRSSRGAISCDVQTMARKMTELGRPLAIFPEGTTGLGIGTLPFKSSLFQCLELAAEPTVQPVAIRFLSRDGQRLSSDQQRLVAWLDDDSLLPHALALASAGGFRVEVCFLEPFRETDRKIAAQRCKDSIDAHLATA